MKLCAHLDRKLRWRSNGMLAGPVVLLTHSHFGRVLAERWIGLGVAQAAPFLLSTGSVRILCYAHADTDQPALSLWNSVAR